MIINRRVSKRHKSLNEFSLSGAIYSLLRGSLSGLSDVYRIYNIDNKKELMDLKSEILDFFRICV